MFSKEELSVKTLIPVTYYGRNRWNSFFARLLWTMNISSVNAEGVWRCSKRVWRPKHKIYCFHHDLLTHIRPPTCKNLLLDLCCYIHSGIIISIQLKAPIQSHWNQSISTSLLMSKVSFALRNLIFRSLIAILADDVSF